MFWNLKEASVRVGDSYVDYAVFGKGSKPMVIIPGLTLRDVKGAGVGLALAYRRFAADYRVYIIDKKADISEGCTVSDLASDTIAVMDSLGITEAFVFGVSLGGMIAQEIAIRRPELVAKLVLGVTASRVNATMETVVGDWIALAEGGDFGGIVKSMLKVMYSEKYTKRYGWLFPILAKVSKPKNETRFIRLAKACLTCSCYGRLENITSSVLVLGGLDDRIVTAEASREIADLLGCQLHLYEGLGHSAYDEAPDFNLRIERFFAENE